MSTYKGSVEKGKERESIIIIRKMKQRSLHHQQVVHRCDQCSESACVCARCEWHDDIDKTCSHSFTWALIIAHQTRTVATLPHRLHLLLCSLNTHTQSFTLPLFLFAFYSFLRWWSRHQTNCYCNFQHQQRISLIIKSSEVGTSWKVFTCRQEESDRFA